MAGIYGRFALDSDGWDDGFNDMRDTGDDASASLIMFAEPDLDPEHVGQDNEDDKDWDDYEEQEVLRDGDVVYDESEPLVAESRRRTLAVPTADVYRRKILAEWVARWGDLSESQRQRFRALPALARLTRYPESTVLQAIRSVRRLDGALKLVEYWSEGDTWLDRADDDDDDDEFVLPPALDEDDLLEAAGYVLVEIAPDLVEHPEAERLLLEAAREKLAVVDVCRRLDEARSDSDYYAYGPAEPERVDSALAYLRFMTRASGHGTTDESYDDLI